MKIFFSSHGKPMLLDSMKSMNSLYDRLQTFLLSEDKVIAVDADCQGSPEPYDELLAGLRVEKGSGLVNLSLTPERWLCLAGAQEHLKRYIAYFKFELDEEGAHHHPEYPYNVNEWYLAKGTMCLIIEVDSD